MNGRDEVRPELEFDEGHLPEIYNALTITAKPKTGAEIALTGEVQQHLGGNRVRCVALGSTDIVSTEVDQDGWNELGEMKVG